MNQVISSDSENKLLAIFKAIDKNDDGYLTKEEILEVFTNAGANISQDKVEAMIGELDTNKDGKISYKELLKASGISKA